MVSIPFREDLYSDKQSTEKQNAGKQNQFPSLSGKTSIRTCQNWQARETSTSAVSIPFREDLHSDYETFRRILKPEDLVSIPFREDLHSDFVCWIIVGSSDTR